MIKEKFLLPVLSIFLVLTACAQDQSTSPTQTKKETKAVAQARYHEPHQYGGWYCPDNLYGFPPVNIGEIERVPAISNRLPTKEETQTGASLIFIDLEKYPDAVALDIDLPKVARIHSEHSNMDELVIIIQAVAVGEDTIVGYRFPSGGNGSAWFNQVTFLSSKELANEAAGPFVFETVKINANTLEIWDVFSQTDYAQNIGKRFGKTDFFNEPWTNHSMARLHYETVGEKAKGMIGNVFGNLYLQMDYDLNGFHFTEKMLVFEDRETGQSTLLIVSGPYRKDFESSQKKWAVWMKDVKGLSEKE